MSKVGVKNETSFRNFKGGAKKIEPVVIILH